MNKSPITPLSISQALKLLLSTALFLFPQPSTEVCQLPATSGLYHIHEDKFVLGQHGERQFGNDISLLIC